MTAGEAPTPRRTAGEFFHAVAESEQPLLARTKGRVRFDVHHDTGTVPWYLDIDRGRITVDDAEPVDTVVTVDAGLLDRIVNGEANAMAALLRGELEIEGRTDIVIHLQRLFPGPDDGRTR